MRRLKWNKARAVCVDKIDDDHKEIYQAARDFEDALSTNQRHEQLHTSLERLATVIEQHFAYEEQLMQVGNYESYTWHKGQHDTARKRLRQFAPLIEEGDSEAGKALIEFLAWWLNDHTGLTDRMMGAFLRNQERGRPN